MKQLSKLNDSLYSPIPKEHLGLITGGNMPPPTQTTTFSQGLTDYQPGCYDNQTTFYTDGAFSSQYVTYDCPDSDDCP